MNLGPRKHYLQSMRRRNIDPGTLLCELIDNSLDAGSNKVRIYFGQDELTITDNGCGCESLGTMLTFGAHVKHETTRSGTNGIGCKDALIGFGECVTIESTFKENGYYITQSITMDWAAFENQSDNWNWEDPVINRSRKGKTGTTIKITRLRQPRRQTTKKTKIQSYGDLLGWEFLPALKQGKSIALYQIAKGSTHKNASLIVDVQPTDLPDDGWSTKNLCINGKSAQLRWIKAEPSSFKQNGIWFAKGFRMAEQSMDPAGDQNGSMILCMVDLDDDWVMSTLKKAIVDPDRDDLMDAVGESIQKDLKAWTAEGRTIKFRTAFSGVAKVLDEVLSGRGNQPMNEDSPRPVERKVPRDKPDPDDVPDPPKPPRPTPDNVKPRPGTEGDKTKGRKRKVYHGKIDIFPAEGQEEIFKVHHTRQGIMLHLSTLFEPIRSAVEKNRPDELLLHVAYSLGLHLQSSKDTKTRKAFAPIIKSEPDKNWGQVVARHLMRNHKK